MTGEDVDAEDRFGGGGEREEGGEYEGDGGMHGRGATSAFEVTTESKRTVERSKLDRRDFLIQEKRLQWPVLAYLPLLSR